MLSTQTSSPNALFDQCIADIEQAYTDLGHTLGWRFLCVSKRVLQTRPKIALLTANPGGNKVAPMHPFSSCEHGCAYISENWGTAEIGQHKLQRQVQLLFEGIAAKVSPKDGGIELMENSLIGYFIPFRSPRLAALSHKRESTQFARSLWMPLIDQLRPKLIITIDRNTYRHVDKILRNRIATSVIQHEVMRTGWGKCTMDIVRYLRGQDLTTLLRLPHLSTFQLFSRAQCTPFLDEILSAACKDL